MPNFFAALGAIDFDSPPEQAIRKKLPVANLDRGEKQYRETIDPAHVASLRQSFEEHGFHGVVWVYPGQIPGRYHLIHGHNSVVAAKAAGIVEVDCAIFEGLSRLELARASYRGNSTHKPLNPVEDAIAILDNIEEAYRAKTGCTEDIDLIKMLYQAEAKAKGRLQSDPLLAVEFVEEVLATIGAGISFRSFLAERLPLLNLEPRILAAVKAAQITPSAAIQIARIPDEAVRIATLQEALENGLSVRAIKDRVREMKGRATPPPLVQRWKGISTQFSRLATQDIPRDRQDRIEQLLAELEEILSNGS